VATDVPTDPDESPDAARRRRRAERRAAEGRELQVGPELSPTVAGGGPLQFLRECVVELRRVNWPGREEITNATAVVLIASIVLGIYLYALDSVFTQAARWLIDQQAG